MNRSITRNDSEIMNSSVRVVEPKFYTPSEVRARPGMHYIPNVKSSGADGSNPPLIALSKHALRQIAEYKAAHPDAS